MELVLEMLIRKGSGYKGRGYKWKLFYEVTKEMESMSHTELGDYAWEIFADSGLVDHKDVYGFTFKLV